MLGGMTRPGFGSVLFGWLCAAVVAFGVLFEIDATDDYVGWIPAMIAVQLPAFLVLRRGAAGGHDHDPGCPARHEASIQGDRRWALVVPAAIASGAGVFFVVLSIGQMIWKPAFLEFRPFLLAMCAGIAAMVAAVVAFGRILRRLPHPRGARRVLLAVTALGAAGLAAMALPFGKAGWRVDPGAWLVVALPVLWVIPLWILTAIEPAREPAIPRAVVSR
jgi:hypothetical protein